MGFGGFFILVSQMRGEAVFAPLAVAKGVALVGAGVSLLAQGRWISRGRKSGAALLTGLLDAGGNAFYFAATRFTRVDVAAVLSSLYSAVTVIMAWLIVKEEISLVQWAGVGLCALAVVLIAIP
jgi:uncharacterized membrane protein